jgi:glycosyltransferase involved in cell wall biosynthesis
MNRKIDVFYELENARSSSDLTAAVESFRSLLAASVQYQNSGSGELSLFIIRSEPMATDFLNLIEEIGAESKVTSITYLQISESRYFAAKNVALENGDGEFLVFCDSDCTYELDYFSKMASTLASRSASVVYGTTYAPDRLTRFQSAVALSWLFPPSYIGYGVSWPKSRWANNFGTSRRIFQDFSFPDVQSRWFGGVEMKQERLLWERLTSQSGIAHETADIRAHHAQFSRLSAWLERQWAHGLGSSTRLRNEGKNLKTSLRLTLRPIRERAQHLEVLRKSRRREGPYALAKFLLRLSVLTRAIACIVVYSLQNDWTVTWNPPARSG